MSFVPTPNTNKTHKVEPPSGPSQNNCHPDLVLVEEILHLDLETLKPVLKLIVKL